MCRLCCWCTVSGSTVAGTGRYGVGLQLIKRHADENNWASSRLQLYRTWGSSVPHMAWPVAAYLTTAKLCCIDACFCVRCCSAGSRVLPYVVLKGAGVAIGRGKEALWAVGGGSSAAGTPRSALANGCERGLTEVLKRNLGFVEVADGRVSRLHCIISLAHGPKGEQQPILEDCSSNGTFLNHTKLAKGESGKHAWQAAGTAPGLAHNIRSWPGG